MEENRSLRQLLAQLPAYDVSEVEKAYRAALERDDAKIIVLDDDPTGVQTVHDVYVYTDWKTETLCEAFGDGGKLSFILTNSRGLTEAQTRQAHREIAEAIFRAARESGREVAVISRSDSTLRGHYPLETQTLRETLEALGAPPFDGEILLPFFEEGGRYTAENVHYVAFGDCLVPAAGTEFAHDRTFGYRNSNLCRWIEEKTDGMYPAERVQTVSLRELRATDYAGIERKLCGLTDFGKLVVNAVSEEDVKVFVTALFAALKKGKHFLYRSAAALAKVMGGIDSRPLLSREELVNTENRNGGLIVVGSHVNKTTAQLAALREKHDIAFIEINQHLALDETAFAAEMDRVIAEAERNIRNGVTCAVYTRRERFDLNNGSKEDELRLAVRISDAVTSVVSRLSVRPNFIIAKGGITSSEIGTAALRCRRARVMGQILKGIPVWETGEESLFPHMPYVIFPGNVGSETALCEAVEKMRPE